MSAVIMDGKLLAQKIKLQVAEDTKKLSHQPGLAVILVGDNPASQTYVKNKKKDCEECGFYVEEYILKEDIGQDYILNLIKYLNQYNKVDGILCQLPLPKGYDYNESEILNAIDPKKDVDAFHPINVGNIMIGDYDFLPCTPFGVMELLNEYNIDVSGKVCVVIGRSNIVGKPMSMLLLHNNASVIMCHSKTKNLKEFTTQADIIISAVGKNNLITADMIKDNAIVIDVAMNRNEQGKLCGDVDFDNVSLKASYITPVPGGVGPMTRAMLMKNTLKAALIR